MTTMFRSFLAGGSRSRCAADTTSLMCATLPRIADCAENGQRGCGYILSGHYTTIRDMLEALQIRSRCTAHGNISAAQACPERGEGL